MGCSSSTAAGGGGRPDPYKIPKPEYKPPVPSPPKPNEYNQATPQVTPHSSNEPPVVFLDQTCRLRLPTRTHRHLMPHVPQQTPSQPGAHHVSGPAPSAATPFHKRPHAAIPSTTSNNDYTRIAPFTPTSPVVTRNHGFDNVYIRGKLLGSGAFAQVFMATHKHSQNEFAVKVVDRS